MFVQDVSKEAISVGESLRARTLPHTDHSVLLGMQDTALELKTKSTVVETQRQEDPVLDTPESRL